jgi:hypothetical protein
LSAERIEQVFATERGGRAELTRPSYNVEPFTAQLSKNTSQVATRQRFFCVRGVFPAKKHPENSAELSLVQFTSSAV